MATFGRKLSSGFSSSAHLYTGSAIDIFRSGKITCATSGSGDLSNGTDMAAFDCWARELVIIQTTKRTTSATNIKLSIGTSTDDDKFVNSLALSAILSTKAGRQVHRIPFGTGANEMGSAYVSNLIKAGDIVEFDQDAAATTATAEFYAMIVCDGQGEA